MAIPVARMHAALPALLPTPPKWKMLPLLVLPTPCVRAATILPLRKPLAVAKPSRADSDERWDAHKAKPPASAHASSASPGRRRSPLPAIVSSSSAGRAAASSSQVSDLRNNAASPPPPRPSRADCVERWDARKKAAIPVPASSSSSSSGASSSLVSSTCTISRASSAERWDDVHRKRCPPQTEPLDDDGESRSTGSDDIDAEEIRWKPRAMYAGPSFVVASPEPSMIPMPTVFLVRVAA